MAQRYNSLDAVLSVLRSCPRDRQGMLLNNQDYAFKVLVSVVGELAALTATYTNNTRDRETASKVLGAITTCVVALADGYNVDLASAIGTFLSNEAGSEPTRKLTVSGGLGVSEEPAAGPLSPRTVSNFFPELDRYRSKTREEYNDELYWFVLRDDGTIVDLKPNGRNIPVRYDELQYYLTLAETFRQGPSVPTMDQQRVHNVESAPADTTPNQRITKVLQVSAPGYDAAKEASLFSPTHFDKGLFAPLATATSVAVTYDRKPTESPPARMLNGSQNRAPSAGSPNANANQSEVDRFWSTISQIERHEIPREDVASCGLTFSVPTADGSVIELITSGSKIQVTRSNVDSFLASVKEKMANPNTARIMRTGSIRPMVVTNVPFNPVVDEGKFSPSHFSGNLFSPFTSNTAVNVDLNAQDLVPTSLRNNSAPSAQQIIAPNPQQLAIPNQQQYRDPALMNNTANNASRSNSNGSGANALAALRNFRQQQVAPKNPFVERIRTSDDEFVAILSQLDGNHALATEYSVTYCIPTACVNKAVLDANPSADADGVFDLVPNGRNIPVNPSNVPDYFQMIEGAAKV